MRTTSDWHSVITAESRLPPDAARRLCDIGFVVLPGPVIPGGLERLSQAYDHAVATADPADVRIASSTRANDLVNRGSAFDGIYIYGPLLAACALIIGSLASVPRAVEHGACDRRTNQLNPETTVAPG